MRCLRCDGCLHWESPEWGEPVAPRCLNCGWRENIPVELPQENRGRKSEHHKTGAQLPVILEIP